MVYAYTKLVSQDMNPQEKCMQYEKCELFKRNVSIGDMGNLIREEDPLHSPRDKINFGLWPPTQLEPTESMVSCRTEWVPARASTELRKHARQIGGHTAAHVGRISHTVLVLAEIVSLAPLRVRQDRVRLGNQLELLLIAALTEVVY